MAKAFSVASWNVEHFGATNKDRDKPKKPVAPIIDYLADQNADVVAVYEVVGKTVFDEIVTKMDDYQFHITEGPQTQEIMIGVKKSFTSFFTQKTEFKSGEALLRPGALLTLIIEGRNYPLLFLHLKSLGEPKGFGLRDDMTERAIHFKKVLNNADPGGNANFIFLGDLNTMGMNLTYSEKDISGEEEIERLRKRLAYRTVNMQVLQKTREVTYWPGSNSVYEPVNLDHVVASSHLAFSKFNGRNVDVRGWVDESTDEQKDAWTEKYWDHALLYFEVRKV
ncbi:endonuclease/exonuclease/phosphatase family protein [Fodinibius sediminis]|uniref:Endonuclease/Exonuclease/phosphatase family protein n=1 Tax=Fodinibius sediminis TaxID=1214077 RepID=A0A521CG99_9BACT|nr:endonuclease/exonuclease/phosphatase family protein [Fodinibius sediminis]SMO58467.1 Endonuclease/Exonuclease/phosphatase family protein [Fodinibius sediminis]